MPLQELPGRPDARHAVSGSATVALLFLIPSPTSRPAAGPGDGSIARAGASRRASAPTMTYHPATRGRKSAGPRAALAAVRFALAYEAPVAGPAGANECAAPRRIAVNRPVLGFRRHLDCREPCLRPGPCRGRPRHVDLRAGRSRGRRRAWRYRRRVQPLAPLVLPLAESRWPWCSPSSGGLLFRSSSHCPRPTSDIEQSAVAICQSRRARRRRRPCGAANRSLLPSACCLRGLDPRRGIRVGHGRGGRWGCTFRTARSPSRAGTPSLPPFQDLPYANFRLASPGYFRTMGIALQRGRDFTDQDGYDDQFVVIVSEALARRCSPIRSARSSQSSAATTR